MPLPQMIGEFRAGGDAELRFTPSGQAVANFSIIANSAKLENGEWVTTGETGWIRVNAWGSLAERCANDVTKGCRVFVVGRYQVRKFETRDGGEGTSIELTADAVEVLRDRPKQDGGQQQRQQGQQQADPWAGANSGRQQTPDPWGAAPSGTDEPPF